MIELISSLQNPRVRFLKRLLTDRSARYEAGQYLAEGEHMVTEALRENRAAALYVREDCLEKYSRLTAGFTGSVTALSARVYDAVADTVTPQGITALCPMPGCASLPDLGDSLVILNRVQDPGNVGTILRTMDASGFTGLIIDSGTCDPYSPKTLRATMGAVFRIPVLLSPDLPAVLDSLAADGYDLLAGELHGEDLFRRRPVRKKAAVMIGNEGAGLDEIILRKATLRLKIPMPGKAESLNAGVAGAIMMYDILRERALKDR